MLNTTVRLWRSRVTSPFTSKNCVECVTLNEERKHEDLLLKIGMHEGPCLAVMLNDRLDYFGQTVNIAARVQGLAMSRSIFATKPVVAHEQSAQLLGAARLTPVAKQTLLRGIADQLTVYEIP